MPEAQAAPTVPPGSPGAAREATRDPTGPGREEAWLNLHGLSLHYVEYIPAPGVGATSKGAVPVLGLHGLASSSRWYDLVFARLAGNFRCLALDQRAHGQSDQPATGYDWSTLSADVARALERLDIKVVNLVGHSWGGQVALHCAAHYPQLVRRLILVDGGFFDGRRLPGATWESFRERLAPRDIYGSEQRYLGVLRRQLADHWAPELEPILLSMVRRDSDGTVHERLEPGNHEQVLRAMWEEPPSVLFAAVRCPTLIVAAAGRGAAAHAGFRQVRREMVEAAANAIADCRVSWVADTNHDIGLEQPDELARLLEAFL